MTLKWNSLILSVGSIPSIRDAKKSAALWCRKDMNLSDVSHKKKTLTYPKFNIAPENRPSQKEIHLLTIDFRGLC